MKNQFFYTRTVNLNTDKGPSELTVTESFDLNRVIRSVMVNTEELVVLLDDFHERALDVPIRNKAGKEVGVKREKNVYQSEISLKGDNIRRFREATEFYFYDSAKKEDEISEKLPAESVSN